MTFQTTTGSRIELARNQVGLSVSQLARGIGVKPKTVENWEYDRSEPRADKLLKLAGVLQVPLVWLLTGEDSPETTHRTDAPETALIVQKLERALTLQNELSALLGEVAADVARLQDDIDDEQDVAA